jgi:NAD(P)-dependent dehydrogenase (short-subunit alcohol dehydrogenase family)
MAVSEFDGQVALVTGAASGIGRATATRLAQEGAKVVVVDIDQEAGGAVATEINGVFARADVSDPTQIEAAVETALNEFGRLDIAHLNAGIGERDVDVTQLDRDAYTRAFGINVGGVVFGTGAAAKAMKDGGAIVATASLAGLVPYPGDPIYGLTKHAVIGFVRSVADQLTDRKIRINAVCPGFVETPMLREMVPLFEQSGFPLLKPEDVADSVVQIVTSGETGQVFVCQPGRTCELYKFRGVPGPRGEGIEGMAPPRPG